MSKFLSAKVLCHSRRNSIFFFLINSLTGTVSVISQVQGYLSGTRTFAFSRPTGTGTFSQVRGIFSGTGAFSQVQGHFLRYKRILSGAGPLSHLQYQSLRSGMAILSGTGPKSFLKVQGHFLKNKSILFYLRNRRFV